jgi:hypothetical protein
VALVEGVDGAGTGVDGAGTGVDGTGVDGTGVDGAVTVDAGVVRGIGVVMMSSG